MPFASTILSCKVVVGGYCVHKETKGQGITNQRNFGGRGEKPCEIISDAALRRQDWASVILPLIT